MNISKKLFGTAAGDFLPFALSKLRFYAEAGNFPFSHTVQGDAVTILVQAQDNEQGSVTIWADSGWYEFFTSGDTVEKRPIGPGTEGIAGYALRVLGKSKVKTLGSTKEDSTKWTYKPNVRDMTGLFSYKNTWQIDATPEHTFYPSVKIDPANKPKSSVKYFQKGRAMFDPWPQGSSHATLYWHSGITDAPGSSLDIMYDIAPTIFNIFEDTAPVPDADWYRHAALQTVPNSEYGDRTFVVMADISNVFHIYPVITPDYTLADGSAYKDQDIKTSIEEKFVQRHVAPLPSWARTHDQTARDMYNAGGFVGSTSYEDVRKKPPYTWAFSSTGKNAVSVVYRDLSSFKIGEDIPGATAVFDAPYVVLQDSSHFDVAESLPALVELDITITVTGPNPEDFSSAVTTKRVIDPMTDNKFVMAADYAWPIKDKTDLDDLIVMYGEIYHTGDTRYSAGKTINPYSGKTIIRVANETQGKDMHVFAGETNTRNDYMFSASSDGPQGVLPQGSVQYDLRTMLLAYDLRVLAFVLQRDLFSYRYQWSSSTNYKKLGTTRVSKLEVWMKTRLEHSKYMEPTSALNDTLDSAISNTDTAGMFLYPPSDVGAERFDGFNRPTSFYGGTGIYRSDYYSGSFYSNIVLQGLKYHAGAMMYQLRASMLINSGNFYRPFTIHPDGSWSVVTAPVFYFSGEFLADADPLTPVSPERIKQAYIDIINLKDKDGTDSRRTHLGAINKAYEKSFTEDDFSLSFGMEERRFTGENGTFIDQYLTIKPSKGADSEKVYFGLRSFVWDHIEPNLNRTIALAGDMSRYENFTGVDLRYVTSRISDSGGELKVRFATKMRRATALTGSFDRGSTGGRGFSVTFSTSEGIDTGLGFIDNVLPVLRGSSSFGWTQ